MPDLSLLAVWKRLNAFLTDSALMLLSFENSSRPWRLAFLGTQQHIEKRTTISILTHTSNTHYGLAKSQATRQPPNPYRAYIDTAATVG